MWWAAASPSSPRMASRTASCRSRKAGIEILNAERCDGMMGLAHLGKQDGELRQVGVPLDHRGNSAEPSDRTRVERPDGLSNDRAVVIDQDGMTVGIIPRVPREVGLPDSLGRQRVEV